MRVIGVTPAGRRCYLEALVPHLLRNRHVIDEHHWWLNTTDEADARFIEQVTSEHPDFFKICRKKFRPELTVGQSIWRYFRDYSEPDTLYVRFDDDIVYFAPDAIENLVGYRLSHREPLLVVGNIVNNGVCTHFHQRAGIVPKRWGRVENFCLDGNGWASGAYARKVHGLFLKDLRLGRLQRWKEVALPIDGLRRFSINVISWIGDDLGDVREVADDIVEEELFLTVALPRRLRRPNVACSDALFAHYAYFTQRPYLHWTWPRLIEHYQAIARQQPRGRSMNEAVVTLARHTAWRFGKPVRKVRAHARKHWLHRKAA